MVRPFVAIVLALSVSATIVWCQGNLGGLTGRISDPTGAVVPGATVKITNVDTASEVTVGATSDGTYLASGLAPGRYRVAVSHPGFKALTQEPVTVSTATVTALDFTLPVGEVTESVTVSGGPLQLQTTSAEIGTVMPTQTILDLPISLGGAATTGATGRRQIENFIFLTPGVTGNQWSKSINGAPGFSQEVLIDGVDMQNIGAPGFIAEASPPYEAVEEFKVQNTLYPAEYGGGYGVINFTLKSGTNKFHGDLFDFIRNNYFDSRGFFTRVKPMLRQNEFGGTFGGPVILPKYNGRDRTFFHFAYSGFRLRGGIPVGSLTSLPTAQERQGNFSDYPFPIFDPASTRSDGAGGYVRDPFTGNQIPTSRFTGVAQRTLPLLPATDLPAYVNNYVNRSSQPSTDDDWSLKVDHQINSKQRISAAYWWVHGNTQINGAVAGELNPGFRDTPTEASGYRFNHTYTVTPTILNRIGLGYTPSSPTWSRWRLDPRLGNQVLKIPGIPSDSHGYPILNMGGYASLGNSNNNGTDPQFFQNWSGADDVSWIKGAHQVKFGVMFRRREMTVMDRRNEGGTFNFSALSTSQPNSPSFNAWGNGFASFLLGEVYSANAAVPAPLRHYKDDMLALYAEDVIKLAPKVNLSLGLRYELPFYATEKEGMISFIDLNRPNPGAGNRPGALVFLGNGTGRTGTNTIIPGYNLAFSPRFALTYGIGSKTVLRMGYGIFRIETAVGRLNGCNFWCSGFGLQPAYATTNQGITPVFTLDQGFPANPQAPPIFDPALNNGGTVSMINWHANKPGTLQSWTFDIQRDLPFGIMLDLAYVGSKSNGTWTGLENPNQVDPKYLSLGQTLLADINSPQAIAAGIVKPYANFTGSVAQALRPYPQYTTVQDMYQPTGYNFYNSLQMRLQKRYSSGMSFLVAYTLSKNIGLPGGDIFGDNAGGGGTYGIDTFNRKLEKATLSNDQTHILIFSYNYDLPIGRNKRFLANLNPVLNKIVEGWQINGIQTYRSGTLVGVSGGGAIPLFQYGTSNRPNWISANVRSSVSMSTFDPAKDRYLNADAFSQPAPYTFGSAPPRMPHVRTPFYYNEDVSFFKNTYITETVHVQFRAEMYDIFNRVVFSGPSGNFNNLTTFGVISGQANTPRLVQLALKLVF